MNTYGYVGGNPIRFIDPKGTTWGSNWNFLGDWVNESGSANRNYGQNDVETQEMMGSNAAGYMRDKFKDGSCKNITRQGYSTLRGLWDTGIRPWQWGSTATQVGGFIWSATNIGDCKVRYRVYNQASIYSLFYHIPGLPHKPRGGSFPFGGNIDQTFEWVEKSPCGCNCNQ